MFSLDSLILTVALARWARCLKILLNRFNGFGAARERKTVETVQQTPSRTDHRAKATVRMKKIKLNQYEISKPCNSKKTIYSV
jgi:hypothetical protein